MDDLCLSVCVDDDDDVFARLCGRCVCACVFARLCGRCVCVCVCTFVWMMMMCVCGWMDGRVRAYVEAGLSVAFVTTQSNVAGMCRKQLRPAFVFHTRVD